MSPTPAPRAGDLVFVRNANVFSHKQGLATGPLLRDKSGRVIVPMECDTVQNFCGGMAVAERKGRFEVIEASGKTVWAG